MNEENILICVIGPSGSGKSTRVNNFIASFPDTANVLVSDTTREIRKDEVNGREYNFVNVNDFRHKRYIERTFYNGNSYGLSEEELIVKRNAKPVTFFICNTEGYKTLRHIYNNVYSIYMKFPSSQCIINMANRKDDLEKIKNRVFYDASIDAYTINSKIYFDKTIEYESSWSRIDEKFENAVFELIKEHN